MRLKGIDLNKTKEMDIWLKGQTVNKTVMKRRSGAVYWIQLTSAI